MRSLPDNAAMAKVQRKQEHNFGSLDPRLLAVVRLVNPDGSPRSDSSEVVTGVMTDGDLELSSQYSTPFENSNPEQKFPTLLGMIQSGQFVASLGAVAGNVIGEGYADKALELTGVNGLARGVGDKLESLQGRSNLTKVNSTQIFVSTQPVGISCTLFFRAWRDALSEVEEQVRRLEEWAVPELLSEKGILESISANSSLAGLFPSKTPPFVSITYGGVTATPMLLESVGTPLVVERDQNARRLAVSVQCRFVSRQAWDARNVRSLYGVPSRK